MMNWIEVVRRVTIGEGREAAHRSGELKRRRELEALIGSVTQQGNWDLRMSDKELAAEARNIAASLGGSLRLSDPEIVRVGNAVVWNLRFLPKSTDA